MKPLNQSFAARDLVRPFPTGDEQIPTFGNVSLEIEVEMAGFGTAGPVAPTPALDALLRIAGRSRTITAATKVDYALVFPGTDTATLYWYRDGRLHKAFGCRASLKRRYKRNDVPVYVFSVMGLYGGVSAAALPTADLSAFIEPVVCVPGSLVSTLFGIGGIGLESLEIDDGVTLEHRNLPNQAEYIRAVSRVSKGSIEIESVPQATYDFWAAMRAGTKGALSVTLGTVAGNIIVDTAPRVQVKEPDLVENQSLEHLKLNLAFLPTNAGNDESLISVR